MRTFKDNQGREWTIAINVDVAKRVLDLTGISVVTLTPETLDKMVSDAIKLVDVVYAIVKPQADSRSVARSDFDASIGGASLDNAIDAFIEELISFFPKRQRDLLAKVWTKSSQAVDMVVQEIGARLDDPATLNQIRLSVATMLSGQGSTASPDVSESPPDPSPSANSG